MTLSLAMTGSGTIGEIYPGWEIVEQATPAMPGDSRGSVTYAKFSGRANDDSRFLADNAATLTTPFGVMDGRISEVSIVGLEATASVVGTMQQFVTDHSFGPIAEFTYVGSWEPAYGGLDPVGAVVDADDNLHVLVDRASAGDCVFVFDRNGNQIDTWGAYGFGTSDLYGVTAIAIDGDGSFYVGNANSGRVSVFDSSYAYVSQFGASGSGDGQFQNIAGIGVAPAGDVYVTDSSLDRVQRFDPSHVFDSKWGSSGSGDSQFMGPAGVAVDSSGYVYVADRTLDQVKKYSASGTWQWTATAVDALGLSYAADHVYVTTTAGLLKLDTSDGAQASGTDLLTSINLAVAVAVTDSTLYAVEGSSIVGHDNRVFRYFGPGDIPLSAALEYYVAEIMGGIGSLTIDFQATDQTVVIPSWRGDVWAKLKELCATYRVHLDYTGSALVVTDIGSIEIPFPASASKIVTNPVNLTGGLTVDILYLLPQSGEGTMWRQGNAMPISAGQSLARTLSLDSSPVWVADPTASDTVPPPDGSYNVRDAAGALVSAATWTGAGGSITARVVDVLGAVRLDMSGAYLAGGDFTIDGLSLVGSGVTVTPRTFRRAGSQGNPYSSPFMDSIDRACSRGHYGSRQDPNVVVTFECVASDLPGLGQTVGRVFAYDSSRYRIIEVRWGNLSAQVSAERYVTAGDLDDLWFPDVPASAVHLVATNQFLNPTFDGPDAPVNQATTTPTLDTFGGSAVAKAVTTSTATSGMRLAPNESRWAVTVGQVIYAVLTVTNGAASDRSFTANMRVYDTAGATLGSVLATTNSSTYIIAAGESQTITWSTTAPASAASVGINVNRNSGTGAAIGDTYYVDNVYLGAEDVAAFSGDTTDGAQHLYEWSGTQYDSTSLKSSGSTIDDFDTAWDGYSLGDIQIQPLRTA
jgi:hypothetical protein